MATSGSENTRARKISAALGEEENTGNAGGAVTFGTVRFTFTLGGVGTAVGRAAGGKTEPGDGRDGPADGSRESPIGKDGGAAAALRVGTAVKTIAGISADATARPISVRVWRTTKVDRFIAVLPAAGRFPLPTARGRRARERDPGNTQQASAGP